MKTGGHGPVPLLPPIEAPADLMAAARVNCGARLRSRGQNTEAEAFERGERDNAGWAMRHEVNKLRAERERANG